MTTETVASTRAELVRRIVRDAAAHDYRWSSIVLGIVDSPTFLMRTR